MWRAAFLDRDGVLVEERGYITRAGELRLLPGAAAAVRELRQQGLRTVVISNQSAVGRGMLTLDGLEELHGELRALLAAEGAELDAIYACPHAPSTEAGCKCRKPAPGLLRRAAAELQLELDERSVLVGDQLTDLLAARAAGVRPVLVRTGKGSQVEARARLDLPGVVVIDSLADLPALLLGSGA